MEAVKQFKLTKTDDSETVMGPIGEDNVYIASYGAAVNRGDKEPQDLEVGESVLRRYALSGSVGVYKVVRLEDAP